MARRTFVGVRLSQTGLAAIQAMADQETNGNLSEMIRTLLGEAVTARLRAGPPKSGRATPDRKET